MVLQRWSAPPLQKRSDGPTQALLLNIFISLSKKMIRLICWCCAYSSRKAQSSTIFKLLQLIFQLLQPCLSFCLTLFPVPLEILERDASLLPSRLEGQPALIEQILQLWPGHHKQISRFLSREPGVQPSRTFLSLFSRGFGISPPLLLFYNPQYRPQKPDQLFWYFHTVVQKAHSRCCPGSTFSLLFKKLILAVVQEALSHCCSKSSFLQIISSCMEYMVCYQDSYNLFVWTPRIVHRPPSTGVDSVHET